MSIGQYYVCDPEVVIGLLELTREDHSKDTKNVRMLSKSYVLPISSLLVLIHLFNKTYLNTAITSFDFYYNKSYEGMKYQFLTCNGLSFDTSQGLKQLAR